MVLLRRRVLHQVAGLSDRAFRFSTSSGLIGAFRLMPLGGIGDWNHLVYSFVNSPVFIRLASVPSTSFLNAGSSSRSMIAYGSTWIASPTTARLAGFCADARSP